MPMKSYFMIVISILFLNLYAQIAQAGSACSGCTACASGIGSSGSHCSTDITVMSKPLTITKIPLLYTETLDLGCNGEVIGLIDIKKIPVKILFFGMTLDIVKLPFQVPASAPYNKGKCVSCGTCASNPTKKFDIYSLLKIKPSSSCTSTTNHTPSHPKNS